MGPRFKKTLTIISVTLIVLIGAFLAFVLNETKDEVKADPSNVESRLNKYFNENRMAGFAVSVFDTDSVIYTQGFGYSDIKNQIPYTTETQQIIASIAKSTIGIALMKAQEMNLLNVKDPINKYLPFPISNPRFPKSDITIEELATHTSSLDYNEVVVESLYLNDQRKQESLKPFMEDYFLNGKYGDVRFTNNKPGTDWNYSNIGGSLAAYIVELVSEMSYAEFTHKYIFELLDMQQTVWFESEKDSTNYSKYYESEGDQIHEVSTSGVQLYPSRDLITNVQDLTKYCQAIMAKDPNLLTQASFDRLLSPTLDNTVSNRTVDNSGLFFMIDRNQYGVTYQLTGMNGGDNCINTIMQFDPKTQLGYIFIGNTGQSDKSRSNHIWIFRTLVSLGDHVLQENSSLGQRIKYKWHNVYNRVRGLF